MIFCERFPLTAGTGDGRLIPMHLWRKRVGTRWWRLRCENLTERFRGSLAVIERPGTERVTLEICCETKHDARVLVREFGGSIERLRRDWLQHFTRRARAEPLRIGSRLVILSAPSCASKTAKEKVTALAGRVFIHDGQPICTIRRPFELARARRRASMTSAARFAAYRHHALGAGIPGWGNHGSGRASLH